MTTTLNMNVPARIKSSDTIFCGPNGDKTYWQASISILGIEVANVGCNGEGRYKTRKAAENAAIAEARDRMKCVRSKS